MLVYKKGRVMCRLAIDILHGHRSAFTFRFPWNVDTIAMIMRKVEHGSGMGRVENSLESTVYENTETDAGQKATHEESAPNWERINKNEFELLKACQSVEIDLGAIQHYQ
jgi:hypothetical protein